MENRDFDVLAEAKRIAGFAPERCDAWLTSDEPRADEHTALRNLKGTIIKIRELLAELAAGTIRANVFDAVAGAECVAGLRFLETLHRFDGCLETPKSRVLARTE
jgi:hypothetical protein